MEIIKETVTIDYISDAMNKYFTENTLLFDIECTGLSPKMSFIYLIGCAERTGNEITYIQFFANGYEDEKPLLNAFNDYLNNFENLMGYNSTRFDEPFIVERCKKYAIETSIAKKNHKDLYLTTTKTKVLLNLPNYKQKTIEEFLGLNREDKYNGGELIPVYNNYSETGDEESKQLVLLHNLEDVKGMVFILDIISYADLFGCNVSNITFLEDAERVHYSMDISVSLKNEISKLRDCGMYIVKDNHVKGVLNKFKGKLYTYLSDYKNYYYIISEEIIIPKVLGSSIDKSNRRNATKKDCAVAQESEYVMVPEGIKFNNNVRVFKANYDSKIQYIDTKDLSEEVLEHIFKFMLKH